MLRKLLILLSFLVALSVQSQNITVDSQTYTPQQLIENVLIDSNCISNVTVTNSIGGDFNGADQSYGFFDATGTTFPFQSGIVLSTGRLTNVQGPNTSLSDDDAPNWIGDSDLETALQESNTLNATIIEFEFTTIANQISFRYIFASEEYQEGDPNTCEFSDLFGFLIRPVNDTVYENIALVPGTQTPVKVTTVHPEIPNGCAAENEAYFESFNGPTAPINFNGQTTILTATANTIPNETYHVKLVIADEQNFRFDSAVFLEAGSFELTTDLGEDRLIATNTSACENDIITLDASQPGMNTYRWFRDGLEQTTQVSSAFDVTGSGTYTVEVTLSNGCISYGEIIIEYAPNPVVANTTLIECDSNQDGLTTYNLFEASDAVTQNNSDLGIIGFYTSFIDAQMQINGIQNPEFFDNTSPMQTIFAEVIDLNTGCSALAEIVLDIATNTLNLQDFDTCDDETVDGFTTFNLNDIRIQIESQTPANYNITFYTTINDAFAETNSITGSFSNTIQDSQTIVVKVTTDTNQCYAISDIRLNVLFTPQLLQDESLLYCLNSYPETVALEGGITNGIPNNFYYQWFFNGTDTGITTPTLDANEIGVYTVIVTNSNGCSNTRDLTLNPSNAPTIDNLELTELTTNNTATVSVSGEGDYEFAIDNASGFYQDDNTFSGLAPGFYTLFVRDKNGCGSASIEFSILGFPKYFTPNGDAFNDIWKPFGTNERFNTDLRILIFNRYGKLLAQVDPLVGWNGTFNGSALPGDDYWFLINRPNGKQYKGHFALVR